MTVTDHDEYRRNEVPPNLAGAQNADYLEPVTEPPRHWAVIAFFFQAEDGIRDYKVTGVQTCALPIFLYGEILARAAPSDRAPGYRRGLALSRSNGAHQELRGSGPDFATGVRREAARVLGGEGRGARRSRRGGAFDPGGDGRSRSEAPRHVPRPRARALRETDRDASPHKDRSRARVLAPAAACARGAHRSGPRRVRLYGLRDR